MNAEALNKSAGIVILFRALVIAERAPTVGALGEDEMQDRDVIACTSLKDCGKSQYCLDPASNRTYRVQAA